MTEDDPTPEEIRYKEVLKEQRESLLEKLTEYAVGTQSNTVEGVKRAAFKHLLDLHLLFSPANAWESGGTTLLDASFSLTLDDELQYRCAGYIQAEIERYADESGEAEEQPRHSEGSEEDDVMADGDNATTPTRPRRPKKVHKEAKLDSRDVLEREYLFIDVVSTFLRTIRAGAIRVQHGAVVLAHYGRLEVAFDTCSKIIVDVLREENIMKEKPDLVASVITHAVQEAYTLVLEGVVPNEGNAVQLAKLLSTCLIVRGSQLSVLRRLSSPYIVLIQTNLLSWITKKIVGYEKNNNKKGLKAAIMFFRVLIPLLNALPSGDALKIKAHMDQTLELAKVEILPNIKLWEPQRAYERRLGTIMAKANPQTPKVRRTRKKTGPVETETDGEVTDGEGTHKVQSQHKSSRVTRSDPAGGLDESTGDEGPITPKAKPRPRPLRRQKTPSESGAAEHLAQDPSLNSPQKSIKSARS